jgi:DsbC/DsbD-like thiol-disulfide interchange protein
MRIGLIGTLGFLAFLCSAFTQAPTPKAEVSVQNKSVVAGAKFIATVKLTIPEGLHAYQNPPSQDYMIPVSVSVKSKEFKASPIKYPKGIGRQLANDTTDTMVYEKTIEIPVTILAPKKPGSYVLKLNVEYQLCNDTDCYPPGDAPLTVKMKVTAPKKP